MAGIATTPVGLFTVPGHTLLGFKRRTKQARYMYARDPPGDLWQIASDCKQGIPVSRTGTTTHTVLGEKMKLSVHTRKVDSKNSNTNSNSNNEVFMKQFL
jgi:hypothetical protein